MENKKSLKSAGPMIFLGFLFIGLGIGFLFGKVAVGSSIGMGFGFILWGILYFLKK
ncbi:MAG: hypothetical protein ABIN20_08800 [candidate division WOR-3 bacterium]